MSTLQAIFRIKHQLRSQLLQYESASASYLPMETPRALEAKLLTLFLPGTVALELLSLQPQGCCLNDANVNDPELGRPPPQTLQELWDAYEKQQVASLLHPSLYVYFD